MLQAIKTGEELATRAKPLLVCQLWRGLLLDISHIFRTKNLVELKRGLLFTFKRLYSDAEISHEYNVKVKFYSNGEMEVKEYLSNIFRKDSFFEEVSDDSGSLKKPKRKREEESSEYYEIRRDSLSRSRQLLIDYAVQNSADWHSFVTLTFRENVSDLSVANKCLENWVRSMRRRFPDFMALGVPEFQKRGAVHYHFLTNLFVGSEALPLQEKAKDKYDVLFWDKGFTSAFDLKLMDDKFNCALYITSYLYKDVDNRLFGRKKVLRVGSLKKPDIAYLKANDDEYKEAMSYIKEKGYLIDRRLVWPTDGKFQIPAYVNKTHIKDQEDYSIVKTKICKK